MKIFFQKSQKGFTLIEVMVVVVILAILAAIVVPKIMSRPEQARMVKAKQDILAIQSALDLYQLDNGFYPSTEQGIQALVQKPTTPPIPSAWKDGGYLSKLPIDPWGNPYHYSNDHAKIKIFTYGSDNSPDSKTEIGNWQLDG
jgi:general secretion pathway protein G